MNNIITIRNVYGKEKAPCTINPTKQPNGLNWPWVKPVRLMSDGYTTEMIIPESELKTIEAQYFIPEDFEIELTDGKTFDLDNPLEANIWKSIEKSHIIAPERNATDDKGKSLIDGDLKRYGLAEFYVERSGVESQKRVTRIQKVTKAYTFIEEDSASGRALKVKLLGKSMRNAPDTDVQDYLYSRAEKNPDSIIELYTSSDTQLKLLLLEAKDKRVITHESGVWMFADTAIGVNDESIIMYFKNPHNKTIYEAIRNLTYPEMVGRKVEPVVKQEVDPIDPEEVKKVITPTKSTAKK